MMRSKRVLMYCLSGVLACSLAAVVLRVPKVQAAVRATLVEMVVPSKPFFFSRQLATNNLVTFGPSSGTLGITNLTFTNFATSTQQVLISQVHLGAGTCGDSSAVVTGYTNMQAYFEIGAGQTVVIPYPSALTFAAPDSCVATQVSTFLGGGSVFVVANGFVN